MNESDLNEKHELQTFFHSVCNGNVVALDFLTLWYGYCHEIDDIIDLPDWGHGRLLALFALSNSLYSHPFYLAHCSRLQQIVILSTGTYGDSVIWEKDIQLWKRQWADVMRHAGNLMIDAVAFICGGYEHYRAMSRAFLSMCYVNHKDKYGREE